jgi:hypothetical protein
VTVFQFWFFGSMEVISKLWGNFNLSEKEDVEVHIGEEKSDPLLGRGLSCLVGKFLADRVVPKDLLRVHMIREWKILGSESFKVLGENLFLIEFAQEWERIQVMDGRPWILLLLILMNLHLLPRWFLTKYCFE